jgi:hypothetical protein
MTARSVQLYYVILLTVTDSDRKIIFSVRHSSTNFLLNSGPKYFKTKMLTFRDKKKAYYQNIYVGLLSLEIN